MLQGCGGGRSGRTSRSRSGTARWPARANSRAPCSPSSRPGANDGTGSRAGRRNTLARVAAYVLLRTGLGDTRVHRPAQLGIDHAPSQYVDHVVDADPRHPLAAATERSAQAGAEERPEQAQHPAGRRLDDAVAHLHHAHPGFGRRGRGRLPVAHEVGQEAVTEQRCLRSALRRHGRGRNTRPPRR